MIKDEGGGLYWTGRECGRWRHHAGTITIHCDHEGCAATTGIAGLEHNGAAVEAIYLPDDAKGWRLGENDYCPAHAPPDPPVEDDKPQRFGMPGC